MVLRESAERHRLLADRSERKRDVIDANQVVAYFNDVNRVVSGLGVRFEGHDHGHFPGG